MRFAICLASWMLATLVCWADGPNKTAIDILPADADCFFAIQNGKRIGQSFHQTTSEWFTEQEVDAFYTGFMNGWNEQLDASRAKDENQAGFARLYQDMLSSDKEPHVTLRRLMSDGFQNEFFVAIDQQTTQNMKLMSSMTQLAFLEGFRSGLNRESNNELADRLNKLMTAERRKNANSQMVFGFKLTNMDDGQSALKNLAKQFRETNADLEVAEQKINNIDFILIKGKPVPVKAPPPADNDQANNAKNEKEVELTVNPTLGFCMLHGYLLISFGEGEPWPVRWTAKNLAQSGAVDVLKPYIDQDAIAQFRISQDMMSMLNGGLGRFLPIVEVAMEQAELPPELIKRAKRDLSDVQKLMEKRSMPTADLLGMCRFNKGIEAKMFSKSTQMRYQFDKPLDTLGLAGETAFFASAYQAKPDPEFWPDVIRVSKLVYSYWDEFGRKNAPPALQARAQKFEPAIMTFLSKFADTVAQDVSGGIGCDQTLIFYDTKSRISLGPGGKKLASPAPFPEFVVLSRISDGAKLEAGMAQLTQHANELIAGIRNADPNMGIPESLAIPPPTATPFGDGTMYFYPIAGVLDSIILPHAVVTPNLLILSTSPGQSRRLIKATSNLKPTEVVALHQPSGCAGFVKLPNLLPVINDSILANVDTFEMDADGKGVLRIAMNQLAVMCKACSQLSFRHFKENEWYQSHYWLNVKSPD